MDWVTKRHIVSHQKVKDRVSSLLHSLVNNCYTRIRIPVENHVPVYVHCKTNRIVSKYLNVESSSNP